jgi:phosphohistidine swiveling domain-containing protein
MNETRYVARASQVAARRLGDQMMVMSTQDSAFLFSLNKVAAVIWEAADGVTPLEEIVASRICPRFDVAPDVALEDAQNVAERLAEYGILRLSDKPIPAPNDLPQVSR